ncbi:tetratricopeptide repeat protein [Cyclonatronum proteinivorum]|uniref:tetratricopeptide repeat protein n=1 Tax=Cyclonatronum proteinivorum TaxID=1457365 RepID=UPI0013DEB168|nr:tetratricopeptide repeat protein [Cyclonatronum proteinivorum]
MKAQTAAFYFSEGMEQLRLGDAEGASEAFRLSLEQNEAQPEAWRHLGISLLQLEAFWEAAKAAEQGLVHQPGSLPLLALRAQSLYHIDPKLALPAYEEAAEAARRHPDPAAAGITPAQMEALLGMLYEEIAGIRYESGDREGASEALRKARTLNADRFNVHNNLAYILMEAGQYAQAFEALEEGLARFPDHPDLLLMQANILGEQGEAEASVQVLERLHRAEPQNVNISIAYGRALLFNNEAVKANEHFQQMLALHPEERRYYRTLIDINRMRSNFRGLHAVLERKVAQFPDDEALARELAESFLTISEFETAHQQFDSLSVLLSDAELARRAAHALLFGDHNEEAVSYYQEISTRFPQAAVLKREHTRVLLELDRPEQARAVFTQLPESEQTGLLLALISRTEPDEDSRNVWRSRAAQTAWAPLSDWYAMQERAAEGQIYSEPELSSLTNRLLRYYRDQQRMVSGQVEVMLEQQAQEHPMPPPLREADQLRFLTEALTGITAFVRKQTSAETAQAYFDALLSQWPDSPLLYEAYANWLERRNSPDAAITALRQAVQLGARGPEVHHRMGILFEQSGEYMEAALAYERALSEDSRYSAAYRSLIRLSERETDPALSLEQLADRWYARFQNNAGNDMLREYLIETLHKSGQTARAREVTRR